MTNMMSAADKEEWLAANAALEAGDHARAVSLYTKIGERFPGKWTFKVLLANAYSEWGKHDVALPYFVTATFNAPHNEVFSLALFHCLWALGRRADAFAEMARFRQRYKAPMYELDFPLYIIATTKNEDVK